MVFDFKKEFKELYLPKKEPVIIETGLKHFLTKKYKFKIAETLILSGFLLFFFVKYFFYFCCMCCMFCFFVLLLL
mgnify:CR=1 FL=1